ncbi:MAG: type I glyceraldehyde-3-phosphate dehydrogenase, partial [Candidatus Cloacimonetes bacterium]|nr:type I glyceraldehyde-3-phosphate dehydrogenase [Candidatus Cloacimonadota bacterium]
SKEDVNAAMKEASETYLKGFLMYSTDPIVSIDIVGNPYSSIFDSLTTYTKGKLVKIFSWYDNEYGYSSRVVDLMEYMRKL